MTSIFPPPAAAAPPGARKRLAPESAAVETAGPGEAGCGGVGRRYVLELAAGVAVLAALFDAVCVTGQPLWLRYLWWLQDTTGWSALGGCLCAQGPSLVGLVAAHLVAFLPFAVPVGAAFRYARTQACPGLRRPIPLSGFEVACLVAIATVLATAALGA